MTQNEPASVVPFAAIQTPLVPSCVKVVDALAMLILTVPMALAASNSVLKTVIAAFNCRNPPLDCGQAMPSL
jgi:hypothetical protein